MSWGSFFDSATPRDPHYEAGKRQGTHGPFESNT